MLGKAAGIALAVALCALAPASARADEDELVLMNEPTTFTDVVDAFDDHDPFDVNITIGYLHTWDFGRIQRESNDPAVEPGIADGRMTQHWQDVGDYSHETNQLVFGLDVGIFRDLALYGRLPLLLSDDRSISRIGAAGNPILQDRVTLATDVPLFDFDSSGMFRSPTRSGVDYLAAGLAWSILNQHRDPHVPTWLIMLEGRFNLGEPMHACNAAVASSCLTSTLDTMNPGQLLRGGDAGVGRGTNALRIEMRGSYRYEYVEPYAGLAFQIEWPGSGDRFFLPSGNLAGYINQRPPILGRMTAGMAIIPWEDREHWQRFSIDLRFTGDYVSEGHDYSPLFDALGSSTHTALAQPVLEGQPDVVRDSMGNPVLDGMGNLQFVTGGLRSINFYGLTDTQSHVRIGGQVSLEVQVARYVRFSLNFVFFHTPSYVITQADACNPNASGPPGGDMRLVGTCRSGIINPHHRPTIDLPGQRFRMEGQTEVDLSLYATAQF